MDDLHNYEQECINFDKNLAAYSEAVALFENNKELGMLIIRFQKGPKGKSRYRL